MYGHFNCVRRVARGAGSPAGRAGRQAIEHEDVSSMSQAPMHHEVLIVGGGNAGISVAARLQREGVTDIGIIEPSDSHYYQPLWTLVGGGCAPDSESRRTQASVMPRGVRRKHSRTAAASFSSETLPVP